MNYGKPLTKKHSTRQDPTYETALALAKQSSTLFAKNSDWTAFLNSGQQLNFLSNANLQQIRGAKVTKKNKSKKNNNKNKRKATPIKEEPIFLLV